MIGPVLTELRLRKWARSEILLTKIVGLISTGKLAYESENRSVYGVNVPPRVL